MAAVDTDEHVPYLNLGNVLRLGLGFLLVFTAFLAQQNLMPQLYRQLGFEQLGFISVAVLYMAFMLSCIVAPAILQLGLLSERRVLPLATLGYGLYVASGLLPATCPDCPESLVVAVVMLASVIIGASAAFVWVPQGALMTHNAPQKHANLYFGVFQIFFQCAGLLGPALAMFIVDRPKLFFTTFTCVCVAGTLVLATLRPPTPHATIPTSRAESVPISLRTIARPMVDFIRGDCRAISVCTYSLMLGVFRNAVPSILLSKFAPSLVANAQMLMALGVGNWAASLAFGRLANAVGRLWVMVLAGCCTATGLALYAMLYVLDTDELLEVRLLGSFCLGLGGCMNFTNVQACITTAVHDRVRPAFASMQLFISLATIPSFLLLPRLSEIGAVLATAAVLLACSGLVLTRPSFFRTLDIVAEPAALQAADKESEIIGKTEDLDEGTSV